MNRERMNRCSTTTGFFVLGRCGRPAVAACPHCGQAVCADHAGPDGICPGCAAARGYEAQDPHDPSWAEGFRRRYYRGSSREYGDASWYASFDEYDRGAFNPGDQYSYGGDWGADDDTGFVDS